MSRAWARARGASGASSQSQRKSFLAGCASGTASPTSAATVGSDSSSDFRLHTRIQPLAPEAHDDNHDEDDALGKNQCSVVQLVEEYETGKMPYVSQDYAYVADHVVRVSLSCSIADEMAQYEKRQVAGDGAMSGPGDESLERAMHNRKASNWGPSNSGAGWFEKLRDELQRGEDIKWYVVVCEDEDRSWRRYANDGEDGDETENEDKDEKEEEQEAPGKFELYDSTQLMTGSSGQTRTGTDFRAPSRVSEVNDYERRRIELQKQFGKPEEPATGVDSTAKRDHMREVGREREKEKQRQRQRQKQLFEPRRPGLPKRIVRPLTMRWRKG